METSKTRILAAVLLLVATFIPTGCKDNNQPSVSPGGAVLVVERSHVNLGSINEGESKSGEVALLNKSRFPVVIENVSASCGCTSAKVADEVIPPGGRSALSVELSPQGRRGPFGSTVSISWKAQTPSDPASGQVSANFQADGLYVANLTPGYVDFGTVSNGEAPNRQLVSVSRGTQEVEFDDVKVSSESPSISSSIIKKSSDQWQIEITLSPTGLPAGPLRVSTTVHFLDSNGNEVHHTEISGRGEIKGMVSAKPKSIFFGVLPQGVEKTGTVSFNVPDGRAAKVKSVRIEPANSCLKVTPGSSGNTIDYAVQTDGKHGDLSGRTFVTFEDEKLGEVSIPFILHVK